MKNRYTIMNDTTIIYCSYKGKEYEVKIDTEDIPIISNGFGKWCINLNKKTGKMYVQATLIGTPQKKTLHRVILGEPDAIVDHKNGDTLDNRKGNLNETDSSGNNRNRKVTAKSGYTGIIWSKRDSRWRVRINVNGERVEVGSSKDLNEAIKLRIKAEEKYWGYAISKLP